MKIGIRLVRASGPPNTFLAVGEPAIDEAFEKQYNHPPNRRREKDMKKCNIAAIIHIAFGGSTRPSGVAQSRRPVPRRRLRRLKFSAPAALNVPRSQSAGDGDGMQPCRIELHTTSFRARSRVHDTSITR
ncbi:hypothetical protein EVAR_88714_1 [Eumeta japonica]|uniref:Uncharacterized protein n=1 Tax=Eumeta variegata TaxID=151549 RepID=A0A4C1XD27_EUMVA|nr:hypothetical protein EVAR_88714_1 [Eumeta japonica]